MAGRARRAELASLLVAERSALGDKDSLGGGAGAGSITASTEDLSESTRSGSPRYNSTLIDEK